MTDPEPTTTTNAEMPGRVLAILTGIVTVGIAVTLLAKVGQSMFVVEDEVLRAITNYALKTFVTVLLLWVAITCLTEAYRLWFVSKTLLGTFAYTKDGADAKDTGAVFTGKVHTDLAILDRLFDDTGDQPDENSAPKVVVTGYKAWSEYILRSGFSQLAPPELRGAVLKDVELQVQGVNVSALIRTISQWIHPPREFVGTVSERSLEPNKKELTTSIQLQAPSTGALAPRNQLQTANHSTVDEASFAVACQIYYMLVAEKSSKVAYSAADFLVYCKALRLFELYRTDVAVRRKDLTAATEALKEADRLLTALTTDNTQLVAAYWMAGLVKLAQKNEAEGLALIEKFVERAKGTEAEKRPVYAKAAAVIHQPGGQVNPRLKQRPVQPGLGASFTPQGEPGTLCCVVREKGSTKTGFVGPLDALTLPEKREVIQPAAQDGGKAEDLIGTVVRQTKVSTEHPTKAVAVLVEVSPGVAVNPTCYGLGAFTKVGQAEVGAKVRMMGRTSGLVTGRVTGVHVVSSVGYPGGKSIQFTGLIACQDENGKGLAQPGDSGAPVVNEKNELIGMLFAGSTEISYLLPMETVLNELNVELVTK